MKLEELVFNSDGLIPAIIQSSTTGKVLMLAYMNEESLRLTIEKGETYFYSRSRGELWHKGATSGNTQKVISLKVDCDSDALLIQVQESGPSCHTGAYSCFENPESE